MLADICRVTFDHGKVLQVFYMLCGGQNALSEPLQGSYTLCGGQNVLSKYLLTHSPKLCKLPTRFTVVKTDHMNLSNPPTHFAVIKTHSPKHSKLPTHFAVVKTQSTNLCKPPTSQDGLSKALQAFFTLCMWSRHNL